MLLLFLEPIDTHASDLFRADGTEMGRRVQTQRSRSNMLFLNAGDRMTLTTPISHGPGPQAQLAESLLGLFSSSIRPWLQDEAPTPGHVVIQLLSFLLIHLTSPRHLHKPSHPQLFTGAQICAHTCLYPVRAHPLLSHPPSLPARLLGHSCLDYTDQESRAHFPFIPAVGPAPTRNECVLHPRQ